MEENNTLKYGIIKRYGNCIGEIKADNIIYYFDKNDVNNKEVLKVGDRVVFRSKTVEKFPQAYYIKKYNEEIR